MTKTAALVFATLLVSASLTLGGCAPEVGSEAWCKAMKDKPKGDWSANDALDFSRHCVL
ncbi:MAG: DUF3012 domain-containing protein [Proteobacteria bacterium]|nr:DUF3012 domain-containing protein [Pseudomonadota bacterium]